MGGARRTGTRSGSGCQQRAPARRFRRRLLLMLLPALVILMLIGGLVDYWVALSTTTRAYDRALASAALALSGNIRVDHEHIGFGPAAIDAVLSAGVPRQFDDAGLNGTTLYSVRGPGQEWIAGTSQLPSPPPGLALATGRVSFWDLNFQDLKWRV